MLNYYFVARAAYEAYAKSTGGKTWDGKPMPTWDEIALNTPRITEAWVAACRAALRVSLDQMQAHLLERLTELY